MWWARPTDGDLTDLWTTYAEAPEPDTGRYVIEFDRIGIGEIQFSELSSFPEIEQEVGIPHAASVDIFLSATYIGRGIGAAATTLFVRDYVFAQPGIQTGTIDPEPGNARAIHSYEKAGFTYVRTYHAKSDDVDVYLMRLDRRTI